MSMECVSGMERAFSTEVSGAPQRIRGRVPGPLANDKA